MCMCHYLRKMWHVCVALSKEDVAYVCVALSKEDVACGCGTI